MTRAVLDTDDTPTTPSSDDTPDTGAQTPTPVVRKRAPRKVAKAAAGPAADSTDTAAPESAAPAKKAPARKAPAKRVVKKAATVDAPAPEAATPTPDATDAPAKKAPRKRAAKKTTAEQATPDSAAEAPAMAAPGVLFMAPTADDAAPRRRRVAKKAAGPPAEAPPAEATDSSDSAVDDPKPAKKAAKKAAKRPAKKAAGSAEVATEAAPADPAATDSDSDSEQDDAEDVREAASEQASGARRRRRRGRRGRGGGTGGGADDTSDGSDADAGSDASSDDTGSDSGGDNDNEDDESGEPGSRRRRRRRRSGQGGDNDGDGGQDDPPNTVTHVREPKKKQQQSKNDGDDGVRGVKGSTRLEAKRQRRRDGRETTRRRAPILTESEFLARREAVDRTMAVRQAGDRTQIAVLEDGILVEHYVTRASSTSYVGNVYLGRVQNVLPSMEAAFIDIGKGRNGVLYAGEVNWDAAGLEGKSRAIEQALKSGDPVLVQVTKDPIGHKGARLTSQVSLPGRFLVYVPGGGMTGISRRLPDTERHRLKAILKKIVPEDAGVIVRTAAEGASEEDLTRDVERLQAQWEEISQKSAQKKSAPTLVHGEPDLAIRVVRDVFNEDFNSLVVQGDDAWNTISDYMGGVAPDLAERASRHTKDTDLFHDLRVDEQLMKALDRKVWLPSGGSLVIDRTEAMTVVDVNTGKYVGSGGNLEQTVTRNNLEAAEEIVRQLRLRDVGGIVVIDFIDMVLESNRELVLRRLTECLGRDRTKHQVAEVTSLGLVQMTRKRVGEGLLEAFSEPCEHCRGRGVIVHAEPVDQQGGESANDDDRPKGKRRRGGRGGAAAEPEVEVEPPASTEQRQAATAAIAAIHRAAHGEKDDDAESGSLDALASGLVAAAMDAGTAPDPTPEPTPEPPVAPEPEPAVASEPEQQPTAETPEAPEAAEPAEGPEAPALVAYEQAATSSAVVENGAAPAPATADSPAPARRRRRAASRPAGPPTTG